MTSTRNAIASLRNEVNCRIEHGADSSGHLEYVQERLDAILRRKTHPRSGNAANIGEIYIDFTGEGRDGWAVTGTFEPDHDNPLDLAAAFELAAKAIREAFAHAKKAKYDIQYIDIDEGKVFSG